MNIARTIKAARERLKLSQAELARRVGVSKQAVAKWELGVSAPSRKNVVDVAQALGLDQSRINHLSTIDVSLVDAATQPDNIPIMALSEVSYENFKKNHFTGDTYPVRLDAPVDASALVVVRIDTHDMAPEYRVGDVVILRRDIAPADEDTVLAHVNDKIVLRQYIDRGRDSAGAQCFDLVSFSPDVETCTVNSRNAGEVLAVVIEHHRKRLAR